MADKIFEVLSPVNVVSDLKASAAIVAGRGVYISGNHEVTTLESTKTLFGIACSSASSGDAISVITSGRVRVYNDSTLIGGTFSSMTVGSLVYINASGKWTHTAGTSGVVNPRAGKVINKTTSFMDVELLIDGATAAAA